MSCNECVFVEKSSNTQFGCKHNRLEKFRNAGHDVFLGYDGYYHIHNAVCNLFSDDPNDTVDAAVERNKTSVSIAIYVGENLAGLSDTIQSIELTDHKYENVIVVTNNINHDLKWISDTLNNNPEIAKNKLVRFASNNQSRDECMDLAVKKCHSFYTAFVDSGEIFPEEYYHKLDYARNELLRSYVLIKPDENCPALTIHNKVYYALGGMGGIDPLEELPYGIVAKIEFMAKLEKNEHLITTYGDL